MGFGESTERYGSSANSPISGLGQGSGASPPAFMSLSSLIVNAYRRLGHGAQIRSSYVAQLFWLGAMMYVDNTNLLHWPESSATDPEELIAHNQTATTDYGQLAQASGGILKTKKCSVYFLDYKFIRICTRMKSLQDFLAPRLYISKGDTMYPAHIIIPQPGIKEMPIITMT